MMEQNQEVAARAQALFNSRRAGDAERLYRQLLANDHVIDFEYDEWLKGIAECYRMLDRPREAGWVYFYLHAFERAAEVFTVSQSPLEVARMQADRTRIEGRAGRHPGLYLAGNAYRGVALNECVEQAGLLADRITAGFAGRSRVHAGRAGVAR